MASIRAKRLVFTGKRQVYLEGFEVPEPGVNEVRIQAHCSLMSTGTENIAFNRNFDPGTHWDKWVRYPFYPGYAMAGVIESIGSAVTTFKPGDQVVCRAKHASYQLDAESRVFPFPSEIPMDRAPWFALAKIALHGALAADYSLGDSVVVIGAGPIGQMSLRWARAAGATPLIVVDPITQRASIAHFGGASHCLSLPVEKAKSFIRKILDGDDPGIVVDTTGHSAIFPHALDLVQPGGRVVILGDTGSPKSQRLTSDAIIKGLSIVGAHDGNQVPGWDTQRMIRVFFQLVKEGCFSLDHLNTHHFLPEACEDAYGLANRDRENTMGILFDWREDG